MDIRKANENGKMNCCILNFICAHGFSRKKNWVQRLFVLNRKVGLLLVIFVPFVTRMYFVDIFI